MRQISNLILGAAVLLSLSAQAEFFTSGINRNDLIESIQKGSALSKDEAVKVVYQVASMTQTPASEATLPISGYLFSRGFNLALLIDSWTWRMDAVVVDENRNLVELPQIYDVYFENGGIKADISYKWMFIFIPMGTDLKRLDGAVYGRGFGVTTVQGVGIEGAWMPGDNRPGSLIQIALLVGAGEGVEFPRMTFTLRQVSK